MPRVHTRLCELGLILAACGPQSAGGSLPSSDQPAASRPLQERLDLPAALIREALQQQRWTLALERIRQVQQQVGDFPLLDFYAAWAYFGLGQLLGAAEVREVPDATVGQFQGNWLLVEQRGPQSFLCCPAESALFRLRRALDGGLSDVAAHLLHARIWLRLGRPQTALELLKSQEPLILDSADPQALEILAEAAWAAQRPDEYFRYSRIMARRQPDRRAEILGQACARLAAYYACRGEPALHREFCRRALRYRPGDPELTLALADAEWEAGQIEPARRLYRRTLELQPEHPARQRIIKRLAAEVPESCDSP
jgi:tetratricopeptide (TPR) repeat protein